MIQPDEDLAHEPPRVCRKCDGLGIRIRRRLADDEIDPAAVEVLVRPCEHCDGYGLIFKRARRSA